MTEYSEVHGVTDIRKINRMIRERVKKARDRKTLTKLYRESLYLVTLTHSPPWKEAFKGKILSMRDTAKSEFRKTAIAINRRCRELGINATYDTKWGPGR